MIKIYIACHKKSRILEKKGYQPIQAGAEGKQDIGYLKDNTGDNISIKNPNFCELTALYWIWKNDRKSDYKGLVHYRRYFTTHCLKTEMESFLDEKQAQKILSEYDIILPKKEPLKQSAWEEYYMVCGLKKDLVRTEEIIKRDYPEYMDAWKRYFSGNQSHLYNMMICRSELFDEYCSWLFDILFKLEKQVDYDDYNDYQKRIFGFLSERLLNVWVMKKGLKVKELRTVNTDSDNKERVKIFLRRRKNNLCFALKGRKGNACN